MTKLTSHDILELIISIFDMDENTTDFDEAEQKLYDEFEVSFENFQSIIEVLIKFTPAWESPLTKTVFQGFVNGNVAIIQREVDV